MDETSRDRVLRALDGTASWAAAVGDGDALVGLADLVTLRFIEELNEQARRVLAPRLTSHLTEMLAYDTSHPSPLLASA